VAETVCGEDFIIKGSSVHCSSAAPKGSNYAAGPRVGAVGAGYGGGGYNNSQGYGAPSTGYDDGGDYGRGDYGRVDYGRGDYGRGSRRQQGGSRYTSTRGGGGPRWSNGGPTDYSGNGGSHVSTTDPTGGADMSQGGYNMGAAFNQAMMAAAQAALAQGGFMNMMSGSGGAGVMNPNGSGISQDGQATGGGAAYRGVVSSEWKPNNAWSATSSYK